MLNFLTNEAKGTFFFCILVGHPNQGTRDASNSFVQGTTTGKNIVAFTVMGY